MVENEKIHRCTLEIEGFDYDQKKWQVTEHLRCKECGARATKIVKEVYVLDSYSKSIKD